ncbi:50S ribosomal protein L29 [candidate division WOR-3 bacterium]|jgi:large subunit ribosomal protein L29|nr:50S ribosomal protein L29 [candidate division WOR-3 bacterium]
MKRENYRDMTIDELELKLHQYKEELLNLRFQKVAGSLLNPSRINQVKKEVARIKTIINESDLGLTKLSEGK